MVCLGLEPRAAGYKAQTCTTARKIAFIRGPTCKHSKIKASK